MITRNSYLSAYFPKDPLHQCDRQFMLDIINTLDSSFFKSVMKEYDSVMLQTAREQNKVIEIDPEMYEVLNRYTDLLETQTAQNAKQRFHLPPKKRKRPQLREYPELKTTIKVPDNPFVQQKRRRLD